MIKRRRFPKVFFGWGVVVTSMFLNLWGAGYSIWAFSSLFKPLSSELGFSRAVTSVANSITRFIGGIGSPVIGWLADRFGPKWVMFVGVSLFGLGLILMNFVNSLWTFYLVWGVILGTGSAFEGNASLIAITNWFVKKRGLALGLRFMLSGVFVLPLITWLITTQGWRIACVTGGIVMLIVGLFLTWTFIRDHRPEYYGLLPDGATVAEELKEDTSQMIARGVEYAAEVGEVEFTLRQAMRTPTFWMLILSQIGPRLASMAMVIHFVPLLTDMGMSPTEAATVLTMFGFVSVVSRFVGGPVADRIKKQHLRFVMGGIDFLQAGGIALLVLNQTIAMVYPFLTIFYVCLAVNMVVAPVIDGRYWGRKAIGSIRGFSMVATLPFDILAPIYLGWVYDTTGSYRIGFAVIAALIAVSAVLILFARPPRAPAQITDVRKLV